MIGTDLIGFVSHLSVADLITDFHSCIGKVFPELGECFIDSFLVINDELYVGVLLDQIRC